MMEKPRIIPMKTITSENPTCKFSQTFKFAQAVCPSTYCAQSDTHSMHIYDNATDVPFDEWRALVPETKLFLRYTYLSTIEAVNPDMDFRYVMVKKGDKAVAFAYFQLLRFDGNRMQGIGDDDQKEGGIGAKVRFWFGRRLRRVAERIKVRVMICGNVFMTGEHGFHHSPEVNPTEAYQLLTEAITQVQKEERKNGRIWATILKDYYPGETHPEEVLKTSRFHQFKVEPNMLMDIRPDWESFEDYMGAMASKYRTRVKSAYKKSKTLEAKEMSLEEMEEASDKMYALFKEVVGSSKFSMKEANEAYFIELKRKLGNRFIVTGYYTEGELVAFKTVIRTGKELEAHFIGYKKELNRSHKVYQRILYDIVRKGIAYKAHQISFARTAMEIKTTIGAVAHDMYCYIKVNNRILNRIVRPVIQNIKMEPWTPRHPFKN